MTSANTNTICLCTECIEAIKSRGERLWIGNTIYGDLRYCEWCEEESDELTECKFR